MRNTLTSQWKFRSLIAGVLPLAIFFQLLSINAIAQTTSNLKRFLADRISARVSYLKAAFSYGPNYPTAGQTVQFVDASTGSPISWNWDFGDGSTSTAQNPSHKYSTPGIRKVTLVATNNAGTRKSIKTIMIMPDAAASFVFSPMTPGPGQTVQFADTTSGDPTSWTWDFGDGGTSTSKNASHVFSKAAFYTVTLISSNDSGSRQASKTVTVASVSVLSSSFNYSPALPSAGQAVQFTDTSAGTPTSWQWNFGDGGISTSQNPSHSYTTAGSNIVTLTVTSASGSNSTTKTVTVTAALTAAFSFSPASPAAGQAVQVTDTSTGTPTSWQWNFGDGGTSTSQNPSHSYTMAGSKTVTLTVTNASGSNSTTKTVMVSAALTAAFSFSPASPTAGQTVQFTDTSAGTPTSWQWSFGDGGTSTSQDPGHSYTTAGSKTVTLTVTNASDSNSTTKTITVPAALAAAFSFSPASPAAGQAVQFTDTSAGMPTSWQWNFGDGGTSNSRNPGHSYTTAGSKTVTLTVTNASGSNSTTKAVTVVAVLTASFSFSPASPAVGQAVQFTDTSAGTPTSWQWNFNDGALSNAQSPNHIFNAAGTFNVTLTVTSASSSNSTSRSIIVAPASTLIADFAFTPNSPVLGQTISFLDASTGNPTYWQWNFGDGVTSTLKNPAYTYAVAGAYTVTLMVGAGASSNTTSKTILIGYANVITAVSSSFTDVSAAILRAGSGDTVIIPAGAATWPSGLVLTKGINLIGAGNTSTLITKGSGVATTTPLITYQPSNPAANEPFRFSGFQLDGNNNGEIFRINNISTTSAISRIRVDHNRILNMRASSQEASVATRGEIYGVVDNNYFSGDGLMHFQGQQVYSWNNYRFSFGSADNLYFEDNEVHHTTTPVASGWGSRWCVRYNNFYYEGTNTLSPWMDAHGNQDSGVYAVMGFEAYENHLYDSNSHDVLPAMNQRGGKGLWYNNHIHNSNYAYVRIWEEFNDSISPSTNPQPQYVTDSYYWGNTNQSGKMLIDVFSTSYTINYGGSIGIVPRENVHYWVEKESFDGTVGTGVGLLSARPSSGLAAGVGYWATDTKTLYRATGPMTWESFYTPYEYPHPLRK